MQRAIETAYAGCRFRSRLEARWAVFFDGIGAKWDYEPEGYELPSGRYLPDFRLQGVECWVEIKPVGPDAREMRFAEELAVSTDRAIAIFVGTPGKPSGWVYCADSTDASAGTGWWDGMDWGFTRKGNICLFSSQNHNPREFFRPVSWEPWDGMQVERHCTSPHPRISKAIVAAKSARFEFGETPKSQRQLRSL